MGQRDQNRMLCVVMLLTTAGWLSEASAQPNVQQNSQLWRQSVEIQPAAVRGADAVTVADSKPAIADSDFHAGPIPKWIWGSDNNQDYVLRATFDASDVVAAILKASCDNIGTVRINGTKVAASSEWQEPMFADITKHLQNGQNIIQAEVANAGGVAAFVLKLAWKDSTGTIHYVTTDESWQAFKTSDESTALKAELRGQLGDGPWGNVLAVDVPSGRVPPGTFELLPGFQVEKLFTVPKEELGSWVCIAFDNHGRLLASDQGDKGICRITLPVDTDSETIVERLDFSRCAIRPTAAQGMLWAFDSLYLTINGGPGSGLYRARDLDGDDQFDECVLLKSFRGGGEHGPHSLRLSPDGQRIFVIAGNHTRPPFEAGEELQNENYSSRIPTNWGEDLLLPRMWDANGHARGVLAPGGWIASTDADGVTWEIWSIGYRNPYDMAFNGNGDLFAYDADMEWDMGMPWYRPTRVVHATSGSEFGWRSGSGKWPNYYSDSLPTLVDIGPGSPVGVEFGYGLKFPEKYQKALYICDWTFGTMYAIHMEPRLSSYSATREEFLSRTPLPLTDVAAGPDGNLYFSVGGRGTQSELYRVAYTGNESVAPAPATDDRFAGYRAARRKLEKLHGTFISYQALFEALDDAQSLSRPDRDRHLGYAGGLAAMQMPVEQLRHALEAIAEIPTAVTVGAYDTIDSIQLLARASPATRGLNREPTKLVDDTESSEIAFRTLLRIETSKLSNELLLRYLRALSLVMIRLGDPDESTRLQLLEQLDTMFPSQNDDLNRELVQVLVYLESPTVIAKTVELLQQPPQPTVADDMQDLLSRNRGYGGSIASMQANAPDQQQIWYAFVLRNAKQGWMMDQRKAYFSWFEKALQWSGGASYKGFLRNIDREAFENASENERVLIEASGARPAFAVPQLPQPTGPGHDWTLAEVRELAETGLRGRNFENGQKMFAATRCILCHRFAGDGGATGPDLTQLAGRFNLHDLTEAILDPSKVISDQYKGSTVLTSSGKTITGRIVSENDQQVVVLTDPEDSTKIVEVPKEQIDEIVPSQVSIMPKDLLKTLNQDEVLDLLAYLLSRGEKNDRMFRNR